MPRLWLRRLLARLQSWVSERVPHSSTIDYAQSKPKPHHRKIKVVKERKQNGRPICEELRQCVRKSKGRLKHQRMFGSGLKFVNSLKFTYK